jgi:hypothetical protein
MTTWDLLLCVPIVAMGLIVSIVIDEVIALYSRKAN